MAVRTLLFTDVVDSTRLVERVGDARAAQVWAAHDRRARELVARYRGREIDRADGFLLLFDDARDAAAFALDYHAAIFDLALTARVGLHAGEVTLRANAGDDVQRGAKPLEVEGLAKPVAARVMSLARGGQTLATAAAASALGDGLPERARVESHGHYRLKGIEAPLEVFEIGLRDACAFTPPADADKAYRVVRSGELWIPAREVRHNLPAERDAFVGRGAELRSLAETLDAGTRLVTVLGPGGMGKTRLVRRYGWSRLGDWPGGVFFCDLSEAHARDGIHLAVAGALDIPLGRDDPALQLGHAIAGRGRCLVVLDNFEQIVAHSMDTVGRWLDAAPQAAFLVTSRERLHVPGEQVFAVDPLPVSEDAIDLFVTRARSQRPDFALTAGNREAIAEIVRVLDGLPLAIELAAARARVLSPGQIVERLRDRFALLSGVRGTAARQATLRAAIDWSWQLLSPWEQQALAQCSVFEGGFTLEAAEAVLDLSAFPDAPVAMDVVQALCDKSLLRTWIPAGQDRYDLEEPFFGMYLSIREFAADKLGEAGRATEERHARYFAGFGSDDAIERLSRRGGVRLRRALALELDNLVAACRRSIVHGRHQDAVGAYIATWEVLEITGPATLGVALGRAVMAMQELAGSARARALAFLGVALRRAGQAAEASSALEEALAHFRAAADPRHESLALVQLGNLRRDQGRHGEARESLEAARALTEITGNRRLEGYILGDLGILEAQQGRLNEGRALFEQAIAIHREVGNRRTEGIDTCNLGVACIESGRFDDARVYLDRALAIHREGGNRRDEGVTLANIGLLYAAQNRASESRSPYEAALAILRETGDRVLEAYVAVDVAGLLRDEGRVGEGLAHCERALTLSRAIGNGRLQGRALATRADLLAAQGRHGEARAALAAGASLFVEAGDRMGLANLCCTRAEVELAAGNSPAAGAALDDAEVALAATDADADNGVARRIAALRAQLNPVTGSAAP